MTSRERRAARYLVRRLIHDGTVSGFLAFTKACIALAPNGKYVARRLDRIGSRSFNYYGWKLR